jgi:ketosteroid isomerase-like protein
MLTKKQAYELAEHWVQAWNSHVLDEIMSHYAEDVVLVSPIAVKLLNEPLGTVRGKEALRDYFKKGLEAYPDLKFELIDVMWGLFSVVFYYINQKGSKAGEFMEVGSTGKITKVIANYNE